MHRYTGTHSRGRTLSLSLMKMAACEEEEFIVVRNERGKANIWRHFGFKKRKTDNTLSFCLLVLPICPWQRNKEPSKPGVEVKLLTVAADIRRERERKSLQHCVPRFVFLSNFLAKSKAYFRNRSAQTIFACSMGDGLSSSDVQPDINCIQLKEEGLPSNVKMDINCIQAGY